MKHHTKYNKTSIALACIIAATLLILAVVIFAQQTFSHRIKSIEIVKSSGPVSPEFQQTESILITRDSCNITIKKVVSGETNSLNCQLKTSDFNSLQKSANEYSLIDKVLANDKNSAALLGGSTVKITVTLQNGDSFSTEGDTNFQSEISPFLKQVGLQYPDVAQALSI